MAKLKSLVQNGLLAMGSLALCVLVIEACLRILGVGGPVRELGPEFDRSVAFFRPDHARLHPHTRGLDPEEYLRIAVVGDSFPAGDANQVDDAFPARLERLLNQNDDARPVAVGVFARPGTSTRDQLRFRKDTIAWRPQLVILSIFLNDAEARRDSEEERLLRGANPHIPEGLLLRAVRASRTVELVYSRLERLRRGRSLAAYYDRLWDPQAAGFRDFAEAIQIFAKGYRLEGIDFVAVIFPSLSSLDRAEYPRLDAHSLIHETLEANDVPYLDLLDAFRGKSPGRMEAFPGVDGHPSEIAHRIAAMHLLQFLVEDGHVEGAYALRAYRSRSRDRWLEDAREKHAPWHE